MNPEENPMNAPAEGTPEVTPAEGTPAMPAPEAMPTEAPAAGDTPAA